MSTSIDWAPGAEQNEVARVLARAIEQNLEAGRAREDFAAMRGAVLVVAQDEAIAATLRFDHGRLTLHDGHVGVPTITLCGDLELVRRLPYLPLTERTRLPLAAWDSSKRRILGDVLRRMSRGELRLYGTLSNPRLWLRFVRVIAGRR